MTEDHTAARVLSIEDDEAIGDAIEAVVVKHGHHCVRATNGKDGLRLFFEDRPDLVVLDLGLPVMDGWQVLERIRELSDVPILVLTARDREKDKVRGLNEGADDYLTKPFSVNELGARIEALLRRARPVPGAEVVTADTYTDQLISIDFAARTVTSLGAEVQLTALEFRLLETFVRHVGQALSTEQLLRLAWSDDTGVGPERVKFSVLRLRRKLGWHQGEDGPLRAVRGYGYRYRPES